MISNIDVWCVIGVKMINSERVPWIFSYSLYNFRPNSDHFIAMNDGLITKPSFHKPQLSPNLLS